MISKRSLIFLTDENGKERPYICLAVFRNEANVIYNYLIIPITSKTTVGLDNLVKVKNIKLNDTSYAKLCNIKTIAAEECFKIRIE